MSKKVQCIYRITCKWNDMVYIGMTTDLRWRMYAHWWKLRKGSHGNHPLQADFKLYGRRAFDYEVLETVDDPDELRERERFWIGQHFPNVYNLDQNFKYVKSDPAGLRAKLRRKQKQALKEARQDE